MNARGRWGACALVLLAALAAPGTASGHAEERSVEVGPRAARIVLSSPVETAFLRLEVVGAGGRVLSGPARRDPRDARAIIAPLRRPVAGPVAVDWRVLSRDGHPSGPTARDDDGPLAVTARFLLLIAPIGLLGLVVLAAGIVEPAVRAGGVAPPGRPPAEAEGFRRRAGDALGRRGRRWWTAWWALVAGGAAGLALLPVGLLRGLREGPDGLGTLLLDTRVGAAWWVQAGALAAAVAAGVALGRRAPPAGAVPALALGLPPAAALVAISWAGHASSGGDRTANVVIDALHSLATAAWLGGLLGLAVLALPAVRALPSGDRVRLGAGVVVRFSALALTAVAVLVVTGVYRALAELGAVGDVADTAYGRALLVKLGLFAVLLVGGAYNRLVAHPRLERAALGLDPDDRGAAAALRVSVAAELALATALMVSVAVLVSLPPPG
ncbi:MAG TPA: CopD family protein [Miltoncostaeaceae bacterium]|nr:CopD family protein [Miltoncostaeaceae bacterium]